MRDLNFECDGFLDSQADCESGHELPAEVLVFDSTNTTLISLGKRRYLRV
jgi:hypothetical protein